MLWHPHSDLTMGIVWAGFSNVGCDNELQGSVKLTASIESVNDTYGMRRSETLKYLAGRERQLVTGGQVIASRRYGRPEDLLAGRSTV